MRRDVREVLVATHLVLFRLNARENERPARAAHRALLILDVGPVQVRPHALERTEGR